MLTLLFQARRYDSGTLKRGDVVYSVRQLAEASCVSKQTCESILKHLKGKFISEKKGPKVGQQETDRSICNFDSYVVVAEESKTQVRQKSDYTNRRTGNRKEQVPPSEEAKRCLESWTTIVPLPVTAKPERALAVLDECLQKIEGMTEARLQKICVHAAQHWVPEGFIKSPSKLLQDTRSGECKTWEAIEKQISSNGNPTIKMEGFKVNRDGGSP